MLCVVEITSLNPASFLRLSVVRKKLWHGNCSIDFYWRGNGFSIVIICFRTTIVCLNTVKNQSGNSIDSSKIHTIELCEITV